MGQVDDLCVDQFIERWKPSGGNEMANFQTFAAELTALLGVEPPQPATSDGQNNGYRFERPVTSTHTGRLRRRRIDLYRRGCFVLEAKQGSDATALAQDDLALLSDQGAPRLQTGQARRGSPRWDDTMLKARNQADDYARAVSKEDGWPPFLIVVDVGHVFEIYSDFSGQGQGYTQFPDGNRYRIALDDLRRDDTRTLLRTIWNDPKSLDPALTKAKVTRDIADHLAQLGRSFEGQGHTPETVASFLMRCLFTMFAEDVHLIPKGSFTGKLHELRGHPEHAKPALQGLWEVMDKGGFSQVLMTDLKKFNGGLFRDSTALPLNAVQLSLLIEAAEADWQQVEPAIFGTLLERALDKRQRHKLGAHYTPRAYVERLVTPTVIEPLRDDWFNVRTSVQRLAEDGRPEAARALVHGFHRRLCETRVLDPACGSGNFLYVALEMMKRLEGEVTALLSELGEDQTALGLSGMTVDPHQFLGIELNPWAAAVAELVLWIGYLQWHFRTHGKAAPSEPVLKDFANIRQGDALLEWSGRTPRLDDNGAPVTRWDGVTTTRHPVTGDEVPDPAARVQVYDYARPRAVKWPEAEFIVGNPPFIGASRLRDALGDGYVEALWKAYPDMPQSADLVMFWWEKAALAARGYSAGTGKGTRRFGLITTNSLRQTFNRRVLEPHLNDPKKPLSLLYAIPDHPWVDTQFGAAVRIAMTVAGAGNHAGRLLTLAHEAREADEAEGRSVTFDLAVGKVFANLQIGADVAGAKALKANDGLGHKGVMPWGMGFVITREEATKLINSDNAAQLIFDYANGRDLVGPSRNLMIIDCFGYDLETLRAKYPIVFQLLLDRVKPDRDQNNRKSYRDSWWIFAEPRREMRKALNGLERYIATTETAKHRIFQFVGRSVLADQKIRVIALQEAWQLAVVSSRIHECFSLAKGNWQGVGNDPVYTHSTCFAPFPFPDLAQSQRLSLRSLGEELDAHRKRQQALHPGLTLTQMYNVLEKLRAGQTIEGRDRGIYDSGLVGLLKDIHDRIDTAVADAYGWPATLSDDEILFRLVALNRERAAEEAQGHVRWLRPDYQNPTGTAQARGRQAEMDMGQAGSVEKEPFPKDLPAQIAAVRAALEDLGEATPAQIARRFRNTRATRIAPLLQSLAAMGRAERLEQDRYAA